MTSTTYTRPTHALPGIRRPSTGASSATRRPSARGAALVAAGIVAVAAVSAGIGYRLHESTTAPTNGGPAVARSDAVESGHGRGAAIRTGSGAAITASGGTATVSGSADPLTLVHGQAGSLALASGLPVRPPAGVALVVGASTASGAGAAAVDGPPAHGTAGSVVTSTGPITR